MEEFNDVSSFGLPKEISGHSVYELNTSMFDKESFVFNGNGNNNNEEDNGIVLQNPGLGLFSTGTNNSNAYNYKILSYGSPDASLFNVDSSATSTTNKQYSKVSSSSEGFHQISKVLENSEINSRCNESKEGQPKVLVIINLKSSTPQGNLETTSITEEVVDLDSANFNILDLVTNEDMTSVSPEDIFASPSTRNSHFSEDVKPLEVQNKFTSEKKSRKRRKYNVDNDDDEDYEQLIESSNASLSADTEHKMEINNNGCASNRECVSPSCSRDSYSAKYKELRDKKNQASRKSSLKRKIKDLELKKESEDLRLKNIKLKAHVEQLEQIVTNYRENLFKMNKK